MSPVFAIGPLILGVVAFLLAWIPVAGIIVGAAAIVVGILAVRKRSGNRIAPIGIAVGAVAIVASITVAVAGLWGNGWLGPWGTTAPEEPLTFEAIDDEQFAALVADPEAHYAERVVLYGEVQGLGENGTCDFVLVVQNTQQESWEGYTEWALAYAASSEQADTTCAETEGIVEFSHVKISATVLGLTTVDFEDGADDLLTLDVHELEVLPDLP